MPVVPLGI